MRMPLAVRHWVAGLLAGAALAACRGTEPTSTVSDSIFVAVMAELKRVHEVAGIDSAQREARRAEILKKHGLTPARLDTAARALSKNPTRAQTVWQAIERRAADAAADSATPK
jgi:hypothetical protein